MESWSIKPRGPKLRGPEYPTLDYKNDHLPENPIRSRLKRKPDRKPSTRQKTIMPKGKGAREGMKGGYNPGSKKNVKKVLNPDPKHDKKSQDQKGKDQREKPAKLSDHQKEVEKVLFGP